MNDVFDVVCDDVVVELNDVEGTLVVLFDEWEGIEVVLVVEVEVWLLVVETVEVESVVFVVENEVLALVLVLELVVDVVDIVDVFVEVVVVDVIVVLEVFVAVGMGLDSGLSPSRRATAGFPIEGFCVRPSWYARIGVNWYYRKSLVL